MSFFTEQTFQKLSVSDFQTGEYEHCIFQSCDFSKVNFQRSAFENCIFDTCDLSNSKVPNVSFQQVKFKNCKILGVHFNSANPFLLEFYFQNCQMDYCNFFNLQLKQSTFVNCRLHEVDFSQANLSGVSFLESDLMGAVFDQSNLEKADFRHTQNLRLDPETNKIRGAYFDLNGLPGLLERYGIKIG
ncbi:pentapeptide repeat-containing protein [Algoriphagus sp.]|uniref:pentapeptide repeat-containing protein n=1 Tax=Algoriphagus sp. TaxID=1872435 RepID=UPI00260A7A91|nr:pentapeptide repeat-containing protein [Algoriphagus sp.]